MYQKHYMIGYTPSTLNVLVCSFHVVVEIVVQEKPE